MSANGTCPIWGTATSPTEIYRGDGLNVDSPRAGGKYFLSGTAEIMVGDLYLRAKARLTTWLIEQRGLGVERPEITSNKIKSIIQRPALSVHNRADGLLKYIQEHTPHIGRAFLTSSFDCLPDMFAYTESVDSEELQYLTDYLIEKGLLIKSDEAVIALIVTVSGYGHLADLETVKTDSSQAFVAMWFDESLYPAYDEAIEPAIKDAGYSPLRIDNTDFLGNIPDRILAEIRRSRFIVADFTQGDKGNCGGVYYEAGFARGLGISVISTCRNDTIGDVHFDISQDNHILWETPIELKERLTFRIAKEIGDGPLKTMTVWLRQAIERQSNTPLLPPSMKLICWNIAHRHAAWRCLPDMDVDIVLLQEGYEPPKDVADRIEVDPAPYVNAISF